MSAGIFLGGGELNILFRAEMPAKVTRKTLGELIFGSLSRGNKRAVSQKGWFWRMCPRSGLSFRGNIRQNHPFENHCCELLTLYNFHIIHSASRNYTWKARSLSVFEGLAITLSKLFEIM